MRKMAILAAAFAAIAGATALQAQNGPPPGGRGRGGRGGMMMDEMLLRGITLTDAQKAKLEEWRQAERTRMESERGQGRGNFEALREAREKGDSATVRRLMEEQRHAMDERRDRQITAIRGLLSSDQYAQFDANVAEMKKREAEGGGRRGRPPGAPLY